MKRIFALAFAMTLCAATPQAAPAPSGPWNAAVRDNMLSQTEGLLHKYYFQERIPAIRAAIEARRAQLVSTSDPDRFAQGLTEAMQSVTHDKHLYIAYSPIPLPKMTAPTAADRARFERIASYADYGFAVAARLTGNVGYLRIDTFAPSSAATRRMIDAAMTELSMTDALIVDVRSNGGGDSQTVDYLLGYFFGGSVPVTGFSERSNGRVHKELDYSAKYVGGAKYLERPVFVLTSSDTFSGAEQFAYDMQALKRATLVGQTTGGGANPGDMYDLTENFGFFVPTGVAENPMTHANWEGSGVVPEVKTSAKEALVQAYERALRAAVDDLDYAKSGRAHALQNPAQALKDALPAY